MEAAPPVLVVEVAPQAVPGSQGPCSDGKGGGALRCALQKNDIKDLQDVFRLTNRQPVPVNLRLRPVYTPSVRRH